MKREEFKRIVKIVSVWKVDRRLGDYELPYGIKLSEYLERVIRNLLVNNGWAIAMGGEVHYVIGDSICPMYGEVERFIREEQQWRIANLAKEIVSEKRG